MSQSVSYSSNFKEYALSKVAKKGGVLDLRLRQDRHDSQSLSREAGFSLIELAIVLVILGMIAGMSLPLLTAHITRTAFHKTRSNQEYVVNALAAFMEKNKRFPCPGEPQKEGAKFGLAQESCFMEKAKGIIPFKTLGISEVYAHDGFKRLMTYVVEPDLTKRHRSHQEEVSGSIIIQNEEGFPVIPAPKKTEKNPNYIAFVLISHGESGGGAYLGKGKIGKITHSSMSAHKQENSDDNFVFVESSLTDDLLRWESRNQFFQYYVREEKSP